MAVSAEKSTLSQFDEEHMYNKSFMLVAALTMKSGVIGVLPVPMQTAARSDVSRLDVARVDVRELLASARGVAPALCALAADGVSNGWGGSWDAPDLSVSADVHRLVRDLRNASLDRAQVLSLVTALG